LRLGGIVLKIKGRKKVTFIIIAGFCLVLLGTLYWTDIDYLDNLLTIIKKSQINNENISEEKSGESDDKIIESRMSEEAVKKIIENIAESFVMNCFARNESNINALLSKDTSYIRSPDGSSFIRYTGDGLLVEGYMDTDKNLEEYRQRWCYVENDKALAGVELKLKGNKTPIIWYLHFKKEDNQWKLFMLENDYTPAEPTF